MPTKDRHEIRTGWSLPLRRVATIVLLGATLAGCNAFGRIADIGKAPELSQITNPVQQPAYTPVSLPMPAPKPTVRQANSLWNQGSRAFFADQRASEVGDLITVVVAIDDEAELSNSTTRTRTNSEDLGIDGFFGYEGLFGQVLPDAVVPGSLVDTDSATSNVGTGVIDREEEINVRVAAIITQKLPNGNMVLFGRQEVRINFEVRELIVAGVIRPEDISSTNTIDYDRLAEARISYGGRGQITDVQQPRYGTQVLDILLPF
ncbi:MAG: flagellar basal body L-ring protein FlgH [Alphaproteobacteria bacterium]|nr:flagellar basal body L-ring protein FlgH [Alphaproteobacteria bacterium]